MTDKLDLIEIAQEVDDDSREIEAIKAKWDGAARIERSTLGIVPGEGYSYNRIRFAKGQAGSDAWESAVNDPKHKALQELQCRQTEWRYTENCGKNQGKHISEYWGDYPGDKQVALSLDLPPHVLRIWGLLP